MAKIIVIALFIWSLPFQWRCGTKEEVILQDPDVPEANDEDSTPPAPNPTDSIQADDGDNNQAMTIIPTKEKNPLLIGYRDDQGGFHLLSPPVVRRLTFGPQGGGPWLELVIRVYPGNFLNPLECTVVDEAEAFWGEFKETVVFRKNPRGFTESDIFIGNGKPLGHEQTMTIQCRFQGNDGGWSEGASQFILVD